MGKENKQSDNYAFIDSQNLNLTIKDQGWKLDTAKFHIYLKEKYGVEKAFMFLGYMAENEQMYTQLKNKDIFWFLNQH